MIFILSETLPNSTKYFKHLLVQTEKLLRRASLCGNQDN